MALRDINKIQMKIECEEQFLDLIEQSEEKLVGSYEYIITTITIIQIVLDSDMKFIYIHIY